MKQEVQDHTESGGYLSQTDVSPQDIRLTFTALRQLLALTCKACARVSSDHKTTTAGAEAFGHGTVG